MSQDLDRVLALAARLRDVADALVAEVRSGAIDLAEAHRRADADPAAGRVFAVKVYEALPGVGKVRSRRALAAAGLADDITMAALPPPVRETLAADLG